MLLLMTLKLRFPPAFFYSLDNAQFVCFWQRANASSKTGESQATRCGGRMVLVLGPLGGPSMPSHGRPPTVSGATFANRSTCFSGDFFGMAEEAIDLGREMRTRGRAKREKEKEKWEGRGKENQRDMDRTRETEIRENETEIEPERQSKKERERTERERTPGEREKEG
jgi:hypothetical protein